MVEANLGAEQRMVERLVVAENLVLELERKVERLEADMRILLEIIAQADPRAWDNGNTDEGGIIDEGAVLTHRAVQRIASRLAAAKERTDG